MEAWYTTALDIEEVLSGAVAADHVHIFLAEVVKTLDTVNVTSNFMLIFGFSSSLRSGLQNLGQGMVAFLSGTLPVCSS